METLNAEQREQFRRAINRIAVDDGVGAAVLAAYRVAQALAAHRDFAEALAKVDAVGGQQATRRVAGAGERGNDEGGDDMPKGGKGKQAVEAVKGKSKDARAKITTKGKSAAAKAKIQHTLVKLDENGEIVETVTLGHEQFLAEKKQYKADGFVVLSDVDDVDDDEGDEVPVTPVAEEPVATEPETPAVG